MFISVTFFSILVPSLSVLLFFFFFFFWRWGGGGGFVLFSFCWKSFQVEAIFRGKFLCFLFYQLFSLVKKITCRRS